MGAALHKFVVFDFNFSVGSLGLGAMNVFSMLTTLSVFWVLHAYSRRVGGIHQRLATARAPAACAAAVVIGCVGVLMWPLEQAPFLYFQF